MTWRIWPGDRELALDQLGELRLELVGREVGEEAEAAEVHAHERDLLAAEPAGGAEERAVAAKDEDGVGLDLAEHLAAVGVDADELDLLLDVGERGVEEGLDRRAGFVGDDEEAHGERRQKDEGRRMKRQGGREESAGEAWCETASDRAACAANQIIIEGGSVGA